MSLMRSALQPGIYRLLEIFHSDPDNEKPNEEIDPREQREIMLQCSSWDKSGTLPRDFYVSTQLILRANNRWYVHAVCGVLYIHVI